MLAGFDQLRELGLSDTQVTDDGVKSLEKLNRLQSLDISHTKLTSRGMQTIGQLRHLTK